MKTKNYKMLFIWGTLLILFVGFSSMGWGWGNDEIRVRIYRGKKRVTLHSPTKIVISISNSGRKISISSEVRSSISYDNTDRGPLWQIQTNDGSLLRILGETLLISGESLRIGRKFVPSQLQLFPTSRGQFEVIGLVGLEDYLVGVLPSEMPGSWPIEALKAQVVATRSYTLATLKTQSESRYHLEDTIEDQVFRIYGPNELAPHFAKKMRNIVQSTKGLVLSDSGGDILRAYYHADCGGVTEEPDHVWSNGEFFGTTQDRGCPTSPHAQWKVELSKNELRKKIQSVFPDLLQVGSKATEIHDVSVRKRFLSGRVDQVEISWNDQSVRLSGQDFRQIVGFQKMKSANFKIEPRQNGFSIAGLGHGHGVGLCQWGSRYWARKGLSYEKILEHYYPQARLVQRSLLQRVAKAH